MKRFGSILCVFAVIFCIGLISPIPVFAEDEEQGRSESNPDGGGVDKSYDADDQSAESQHDGNPGDDRFDGNNGCGQDKKVEDREDPSTTESDHVGWDDNNGWCGKRPDTGAQATAKGEQAKAANSSGETKADAVAVNGERDLPEQADVPDEARVLGTKITQETKVLGIGGVRGSALPLTGGNFALLATLAAQLLLAGIVSARIARK